MGYPNLRAEMAKSQISIETLADFLGVHRNSVSIKINKERAFSVDESMSIQEKFFPELELKYLFAREVVT